MKKLLLVLLLAAHAALAEFDGRPVIIWDKACTSGAYNLSAQTCLFSSGGSGAPSGPNGSIQFNNSGSFGGSSSLTWNGSTLDLSGAELVSGQVQAQNFIQGVTGYACSGTTTLTNTSDQFSLFSSGSGTCTVVLPDATTLSDGWIFEFNQNASGNLTIEANGGGVLYVAPSGSFIRMIVLSNSFSAGQWDIHEEVPSNSFWGTAALVLPGKLELGTTGGYVALSAPSPIPSPYPIVLPSTAPSPGQDFYVESGGKLVWTSYLQLNGAIPMTANFSMGNNSITNVDFLTDIYNAYSVDVGYHLLYPPSGGSSLDWTNLYLQKNGGTIVDWGNGYLNSPNSYAGPPVVENWFNAQLFDFYGHESEDWNERNLYSADSSQSLLWDDGGAGQVSIPQGLLVGNTGSSFLSTYDAASVFFANSGTNSSVFVNSTNSYGNSQNLLLVNPDVPQQWGLGILGPMSGSPGTLQFNISGGYTGFYMNQNGTFTLPVQPPSNTPSNPQTGQVTLTSNFIMCVFNGSSWVQTSDGSTGCTF